MAELPRRQPLSLFDWRRERFLAKNREGRDVLYYDKCVFRSDYSQHRLSDAPLNSNLRFLGSFLPDSTQAPDHFHIKKIAKHRFPNKIVVVFLFLFFQAGDINWKTTVYGTGKTRFPTMQLGSRTSAFWLCLKHVLWSYTRPLLMISLIINRINLRLWCFLGHNNSTLFYDFMILFIISTVSFLVWVVKYWRTLSKKILSRR